MEAALTEKREAVEQEEEEVETEVEDPETEYESVKYESKPGLTRSETRKLAKTLVEHWMDSSRRPKEPGMNERAALLWHMSHLIREIEMKYGTDQAMEQFGCISRIT